ncbi:MAG: epoxyqueuosine reductase QueH [Desulforhopalus sp.]|nr:epoxyqueuosine reductase QueH [Desulforhopalus sp.]
MKIFVHACCAPCLIYPYSQLKSEFSKVDVYFYNPNIHPYREFKKRIETLELYSRQESFGLHLEYEYCLKDFLRRVVFNEENRCEICYLMRLEKTAALAKEFAYDAFTTTLLYSRYQKHNSIISIGNMLSNKYQIPFYYSDFRLGWQNGIDQSIEHNMYRQPYCGCIYSEQERYDKTMKRTKK